MTETLLVGGMAVPRVPSDNVDLDMAEEDAQSKLLDSLRDLHAGSSVATDLSIPVPQPTANSFGPGTLVIPGWIRERAAEVLFECDPDDESDSIQDCVLNTLLKVSTKGFDPLPLLISAPH